jgi:transcriptional regulator with XRE-family HTH domain
MSQEGEEDLLADALQQESESRLVARIAERVRSSREGCNLTQSQLSKASGVGRATISRIENGDHEANSATLAALAAAMRTSVGYLLGNVDEHKVSSNSHMQSFMLVRLSRQRAALEQIILEHCTLADQLVEYLRAQNWSTCDDITTDSLLFPAVPSKADIFKNRYPKHEWSNFSNLLWEEAAQSLGREPYVLENQSEIAKKAEELGRSTIDSRPSPH